MSARLRRISQGCVHAATLLFTGWALIATSAPDPGPARDCFVGVPPNAHLVVALAPPNGSMASDAGDAGLGFDGGVDPDATATPAADGAGPTPIDASVVGDAGDATDGGNAGDEAGDAADAAALYGISPPTCSGIDGLIAGGSLVLDVTQGPRPNSDTTCYGYKTLRLQGVLDVVVVPPVDNGWSSNRFDFTSASGTFSSSTMKACRGAWLLDLHPQTAIAPGQLASPLDGGAAWVVERSIGIEQAQFCDGVFAQRGAVTCADTFAVQSIVDQRDQ